MPFSCPSGPLSCLCSHLTLKTLIPLFVPSPNKVNICGIDKQVVGQFAAEVRDKRAPEPYKGKGVRYAGEVIHLKAGKTGGKK